jgi:hypothetical protein
MARDDLDLAVVEAEAAIDRRDLRLDRALVRKQKRVWQLSMMAGAMAEPSMSDSDCVAKMTLAFFLRSVFSHSRSWPAKPSSSSASQPSSMMRRVRRAVLDAVEEIGEHGGRGAGADQPSVSNA